jgi:stearoyl-CoA desaturase (delta-9 desaturase)
MNIPFLGLFIIGDELHSNHHADPANAKLSTKWWEFDLGWMYIKIFEKLGLLTINSERKNHV